MPNPYFTDTIVIVSTVFSEWGIITETEGDEEAARVEDFNDYVMDTNGKEVFSSMTIFLKKDSTVKPGDKIKIKTKNGIAFNQPDKLFQIKRMSAFGMFKKKYIEINV